ncbi:DNA-deoxyinosine glycosylase [Bifidobacterium xylocopae]|uniref:DNA-deoxyinosine glycosylase n=1 Tax=Bifidobacterium xylocopae TaxID=2493119 RepID=A0A366KDY8_9BIFI|nr:DNA-deoxyinosine glycosylase [Bifidobacterium xylocopae]RBP99914.1 DNA-deoxyinosine glycosylase [Bifidobacterium xylocopae]
MTRVEHGFGPLWDEDSRVLLLGSVPSPRSREAGFYYMNPHNRFWPVMEGLFKEHIGPDPAGRAAFLHRHRIALWDVIASCDIEGARDASISNAVPNDLTPILRSATITHVFTTGAMATRLYRQLIEPGLPEDGPSIPVTRLPSTSPANAAMRLADLQDAYRPILRAIGLTADEGRKGH